VAQIRDEWTSAIEAITKGVKSLNELQKSGQFQPAERDREQLLLQQAFRNKSRLRMVCFEG
jgi:curli biogenesis system outer membrane secretion channel CsgG